MTGDSYPQLLVTCIGKSRQNLVHNVTKTIAEGGGHISRTVSLSMGLQKVFLAYVWVGDRAKANLLRLQLNDLADGMSTNCMWVPDLNHEQGIKYNLHKIHLSGNQRLGLIHEFTSALATKGVQLTSMQFHTSSNEGEKTKFSWEMQLEVPEEVSLADVKEILTTSAEVLQDIDLTLEVLE